MVDTLQSLAYIPVNSNKNVTEGPYFLTVHSNENVTGKDQLSLLSFVRIYWCLGSGHNKPVGKCPPLIHRPRPCPRAALRGKSADELAVACLVV